MHDQSNNVTVRINEKICNTWKPTMMENSAFNLKACCHSALSFDIMTCHDIYLIHNDTNWMKIRTVELPSQEHRASIRICIHTYICTDLSSS